MKRIPFGNHDVPDLDQHLDFSKTYTLPEWRTFVNKHLYLLKILAPAPISATVQSLNQTVASVNSILSLSRSAMDITKLINPLDVLKTRLSYENIARMQQLEFKDLISNS